jgi:hypothetical protein
MLGRQHHAGANFHMTSRTIRASMLFRSIRRTYISRKSFSNKFAGKTSPTTSKTWSVPSSLRISRRRSRSFASTRPSRVFTAEDEAIMLLAIAVAEPAELEVDSLAGGLGGDEDLGILAKLALGVDAAA